MLKKMFGNGETPFIYLGRSAPSNLDIDPYGVIKNYNNLFSNDSPNSLIKAIEARFNRLKVKNTYLRNCKVTVIPNFVNMTNYDDENYCKINKLTYGNTFLVNGEFFEYDEETKEEVPVNPLSMELFTIPALTSKYSFICNGTESSLISQMFKSKAVYIDTNYDSLKCKNNILIEFNGNMNNKFTKLKFEVFSNNKCYITIKNDNTYEVINCNSINSYFSGKVSSKYKFDDEESSEHHIDLIGSCVFNYELSDTHKSIINYITDKEFSEYWILDLVNELKEISDNESLNYKLNKNALAFKELEIVDKYILREMKGAINTCIRLRTAKEFTDSYFLNKRKLQKDINKLFLVNPDSNFLDDLNPVAEVSHKRRINYVLDNPTNSDRDYHETYNHKICCIETPEGQNIGLSLNFALGFDNKESKNTILGASSSMIPFVENDDANRCLMGSSMLKQSLPLKFNNPPKVLTEMNRVLFNTHWSVTRARATGVVTSITTQNLQITSEDGLIHNHKLVNKYRSNIKTSYESTWSVMLGETINKGQSISQNKFFKSGYYTNGKSLLVSYQPYKGYNFDDSIVISRSASYALTADLIDMLELHFNDVNKFPSSTLISNYELDSDLIFSYDHIKTNYLADESIFTYLKLNNHDLTEFSSKTLKRDEFYVVDHLKFKYDCELLDLRLFINNNGTVEMLHRKLTNNDEVVKVQLLLKYSKEVKEGDKLSGQHGNKGVVSKIVEDEFMPKLPCGKNIDVILNTMGIPSRMNPGQLKEAWLGLVSEEVKTKLATHPHYLIEFLQYLKDHIAIYTPLITELIELCNTDLQEVVDRMISNEVSFLCPQYDSISLDEIEKLLEFTGLSPEGAYHLDYYDDEEEKWKTTYSKVDVGYANILRLKHKVVDKFRIRSIGYNDHEYTDINNGGNRVGEMEFWALEAHGANSIINEFTNILSSNKTNKKILYSQLLSGQVDSSKFNGSNDTLASMNYYMNIMGYDICKKD